MTDICDIIIPVWDQLEHTKACIEHIEMHTGYPYRLIVVDNGSAPDTRRYLETLSTAPIGKTSSLVGVLVIRNEENLGYVPAINQGLRVSNGKFVCMMNNDTLPGPGWLERMVDFALAHPDVGLVNPLCNGHGVEGVEAYSERIRANRGVYMEMNQCQGFAMLVKREVIDKIGHLDEAYGIGGYDDTDYSMRAHKAGYRSVAIYDAYVYHRLHASFDKAGNREAMVRRNKEIYYGKWGKHLRLGIAVAVYASDERTFDAIMRYASGLAREWTWVHLWVDILDGSLRGRDPLKEARRRCSLPPHQNIRYEYESLAPVLFDGMIAVKFVERLRKRMRDKLFDGIIRSSHTAIPITASVARMLKKDVRTVDFSRKGVDFEAEARKCALDIKNMRDGHGNS